MRIEPPRLAESRPECGRRWGSTRGRYRFLTLVVAVLAVFPTVESATAQEAQQLRSLRHLGVGNISFLNTWDPSLHAGYLFQLSLRKNQLETDEFGESVVLPPHLYLHRLVSAGWALAMPEAAASRGSVRSAYSGDWMRRVHLASMPSGLLPKPAGARGESAGAVARSCSTGTWEYR